VKIQIQKMDRENDPLRILEGGLNGNA